LCVQTFDLDSTRSEIKSAGCLTLEKIGKGHVGLYVDIPHVACLGNEMSQILKKKKNILC
jgi:hypothetical protein